MSSFSLPAAEAEALSPGKPTLLSVNAYHYRRGGADAMYFDHAALMERHGWTNLFSAMHHPQNLPCAQSRWFADEIGYAAGGSIVRRLRDAGRVVYSPEARRKLAGLLDVHRVDIAHVHNIYHHQSPSVLMELKRRGIPVVLTAHDLKLACPNYRMLTGDGVCERCRDGRVWNALLHRCIKDSVLASGLVTIESAVHKAFGWYRRFVDRIVTPSSFYRDKLIEWGWPADMLVHIPNFAPSSPPPSAVDDIPGTYFLYFGRLAPEKGVDVLVKAAALAQLPVLIAGSGPAEPALRELIERSGAPARLLGRLDGEALWRRVARARAIVLPSLWYENGPMSALEAFGLGKPLIGSAIGGIPEMIRPGETGWTFRAGDATELASLMAATWALPEPALRDVAAACRRMVSLEYGADRYHQAMTHLYKGLM